MYDIIGIGNPLLDKTIEIDEAFLQSHGFEKGQMHLIDAQQLATLLEQLLDKDVINGAGGSVGNTLAAAANLGGKTLFVGVIGNNNEGSIYEDLITSASIDSELHRTNEEQGVCVVLVTSDGERTMMTHLGAAITLSKKDINPEIIKQARILHIEGYQIDSNEQAEAMLFALNIAKQNNIRVSIDLADPALIERHRELVTLIVNDYADIIFLNETEAETYTGLEEPQAAAKELAKIVEIAVVKIGDEGSYVASGQSVTHIAPNKVTVENTTGAGDAYAGAFLQSLIDGRDLATAGAIASYIAATVVAQEGSRVEKYIKPEIERKFPKKEAAKTDWAKES
jgi:sugar/nucleoside kinase (ribokinase family)